MDVDELRKKLIEEETESSDYDVLEHEFGRCSSCNLSLSWDDDNRGDGLCEGCAEVQQATAAAGMSAPLFFYLLFVCFVNACLFVRQVGSQCWSQSFWRWESKTVLCNFWSLVSA